MFKEIKKSIWNGQDWEVQKFYHIYDLHDSRQQVHDWVKQHYGKSIYSKTWWKVYDGIVVNEKIYIHYQLIK